MICILEEACHNCIVLIADRGNTEELLHYLAYRFFLLLAGAFALFSHQAFCIFLPRNESHNLICGFGKQGYRLAVYIEGNVAILEELCYQPLHVRLHKAIRSLCETIQQSLHGSLCMPPGIQTDEIVHIM